MKNFKFLLTAFCAGAVMISSCSKDGNTDPIIEPAAPESIPNDISSNKTLTADRIWILKGETHVKANMTLTIEAGTVIQSDPAQKGALIIDKNAKIQAVGTVDKPIVFTSGRAVNDRKPGDWAGITIIGNAPTNRTSEATVEGGVSGTYGLGTVVNDNSGTLKYVRIEFAGNAVSSNNEVNALSLYAVGNGTTLDHIQVSYAKDDAFEFFGGTVNGKYLIAYGTSDDDFDFDLGYVGKLQFGVSMKRPELADALDQSNGVECDNEPSVLAVPSSPRTRPVLSNFTFVGTNGATGEAATHNFALRYRRTTQFVLNNSVMIGYKAGGFVMESAITAADYVSGASSFKNNLVHAVANPYNSFDASAAGVISAAGIKTKAEAEGSVTLAAATDAGLKAPLNLSAPDFTPNTGSPALLGTWAAPETGSFFTVVTYRGAFGLNDNWMATWTNFNPNAKVY
ncbi:MAG: hypothetical protein EOO92_21320 [Pedobacter sp.]|nr:MAG: hypothetical protein EOO92_21320 [Pedobacter sp.]